MARYGVIDSRVTVHSDILMSLLHNLIIIPIKHISNHVFVSDMSVRLQRQNN